MNSNAELRAALGIVGNVTLVPAPTAAPPAQKIDELSILGVFIGVSISVFVGLWFFYRSRSALQTDDEMKMEEYTKWRVRHHSTTT